LRSHFTSLKMHHTHAHRKLLPKWVPHTHRNLLPHIPPLQVAAAHSKSCFWHEVLFDVKWQFWQNSILLKEKNKLQNLNSKLVKTIPSKKFDKNVYILQFFTNAILCFLKFFKYLWLEFDFPCQTRLLKLIGQNFLSTWTQKYPINGYSDQVYSWFEYSMPLFVSTYQ
jgi:hypothetical protein